MLGAIKTLKFVGITTLGLLTGTSYTLSTQSLPSLLTLPSAQPAAYTLDQTTRLAILHIRALSGLSSFSLLLAYALSPSRIRHPYLLWTSLIAAISGGLTFSLKGKKGKKENVVTLEDLADINGEEVERKTRSLQKVEFIRTAVSGLAFVMGVVGIWGDGA